MWEKAVFRGDFFLFKREVMPKKILKNVGNYLPYKACVLFIEGGNLSLIQEIVEFLLP